METRVYGRRRTVHVVLVSAMVLNLFVTAGQVAAREIVQSPTPPITPRTSVEQVSYQPMAGTSKHGLADSRLARVVTALGVRDPPPFGTRSFVAGDQVAVEILHRGDSSAIRAAVASLEGTVTGKVAGTLVAATMPYDSLERLAQMPDVDFVRLPLNAAEPQLDRPVLQPLGQTSASGALGHDAVLKTKAATWQAAGWTGAGLRIGIIDQFHSDWWNKAAAVHELPTGPAGTFCRDAGFTCNIWASPQGSHGTAVAEVVHDMAPGAVLYLATTRTAADLQAAVDYFAANGVRIITRSETAEYDGPGDGTGPIARVIANAVSRGIAWFNSAGNSAGDASNPGSYWRDSWRDTDGDGWLEFSTNGDELLEFSCSYLNGLRWSDWGATGRTDYDAFVFDTVDAALPEASSDSNQATGALPLEHPDPVCKGEGDMDYLAVQRYAPGSGTDGDILEFMTNGYEIEYWQNPYSATGPAADTASSGAMAIGAIDPIAGTTIGQYSSRGPTNDGRIKPDLSAASNMTSFTYGRFAGTSAATPVVAGAAALVLQQFPTASPGQLISWLRTSAVEDRGQVGPDNTYGAGELTLPNPDFAPPSVVAPRTTIAAGRQVSAKTVPLRVGWSAADASGVWGSELWVSVNGAGYKGVTLPSRTARSVVVNTAPLKSYRFAVRARDTVGNWSTYAYGATVRPQLRDDRHSSITYRSSWQRVAKSYAVGDRTVQTRTRGARASMTFTGRSVAWVGTKTPSSGKARIYVDGVYRRTVDLHASRRSPRRLLASFSWSKASRHVITVRCQATKGHPWVDVDAFVVLR